VFQESIGSSWDIVPRVITTKRQRVRKNSIVRHEGEGMNTPERRKINKLDLAGELFLPTMLEKSGE
jgi:hypothetical protein